MPAHRVVAVGCSGQSNRWRAIKSERSARMIRGIVFAGRSAIRFNNSSDAAVSPSRYAARVAARP